MGEKVEDIKKALRAYNLRPASQRIFSLFGASCIVVGYTENLLKNVGISYEAIAMYSEGKKIDFLFDEGMVVERTKEYLKKYSTSLEGRFFKKAEFGYRQFEKGFTEINKIIEQKPKYFLRKLTDIYPVYMGVVGMYNCFWRYSKEPEFENKLPGKVIERVIKEREKITAIYPEVEKLIKKCTRLIGVREKFDGELIRYFSCYEMRRYCDGKIQIKNKIKELDKRRQGYFYLLTGDDKKEIIITNPPLLKSIAKEIFSGFDKESRAIKGKAVFGGFVRGSVIILNNIKDRRRVSVKDKILVTSMTHPKDLMLIKRCKAVTTDEGGMLSHAAIIARELQKPCIIGTKIATRVFKDGDLVEVDAGKGIVRKI